jgi:hypothetical protein
MINYIHIIEIKMGKDWKPTSNACLDGRTVGALLKACKFQFPKMKFRKAIYFRKDN